MTLVVGIFLLVTVGNVFAQQDTALVFVQVFHRHGSKIPDVLEPSSTPFWARWGNAGEFTAQGALEMESLGNYIRERYIDGEGLLSTDFNQRQLYARASSYNPRPLQSAVSAFSTFYPGAAVPIYTRDPNVDDLLAPSLTKTCPSYFIEEERLYDELEIYLENFEDLFETLFEITEYPNMTSTAFLSNLGDKYESELTHFYAMHPFLRESAEVFLPLVQRFFNTPYTRTPNDQRGDLNQAMGREIIQNIRDAINLTNERKLAWYSSHGIIITGIRSLLGLDMSPRTDYGQAMTIELREGVNGLFIRAYDLLPIREGVLGRVSYREQPIVLNCPGPNVICPLDNFLDYLMFRTGPEDGCCLRGEAFFESGCGDFLNPATLDIPNCKRWREICPQTACDLGQVVDSVTLLCVPVASKY